ncbi:MAG TPA: hypothetical protein PLJ04_03520 [Candidatus Saccharibacteria bacterium]|nr:hypothetical protein [Candidatus Saccharibacteria bacterium]
MDNVVLYTVGWGLVVISYVIFIYGYIATGFYLGKYVARHRAEIPKFTLVSLYVAGIFGWLLVFVIGRYYKKYDAQGIEIK